MAYDIFLVSALEDRDMAKLVARRLRALKFKVWFDQKQTDETFDSKDARNATNSQSILVLWSENSVKSDWVRAAASVGHSRPDTLVQVGLDKTIPYEPFRLDRRFSIEGMTSRKTPEGFYQMVEEIGSRDGRADLRAWMGFGAKDDDERDAWLAAHPNDPLAVDARKKREKELGKKPEPAPAAAGAATLAAAAIKSSASNGTSGARSGVAAAIARSSNGARAGTVVAPEPVAEDMGVGRVMLAVIGAAIAGILLFSMMKGRDPLPEQMRSALPAVGNAYNMSTACTPGTVPRSLLEVLEPGPIINDTEPTSEPEPED
ncbi:MAG: toll/interleukin-1 receptor domain-containing protein [Hyphomonas sp.]|uniref:toll/interleukin-1 receptor domain-containing protein n=1 Tax=Hyphomonas sp. TaxID=87 RepID=UPI00352764F7